MKIVVLALSIILFSAVPAEAGGWKVAKIAPWWGPGYYGDVTACGKIMSRNLPGVAHRSLPCGTKVELRYNGYSVIVKVVDRGPYPTSALLKRYGLSPSDMPLDLTAYTNCWQLNGGRYQSPCPSRRNVKWRVISDEQG